MIITHIITSHYNNFTLKTKSGTNYVSMFVLRQVICKKTWIVKVRLQRKLFRRHWNPVTVKATLLVHQHHHSCLRAELSCLQGAKTGLYAETTSYQDVIRTNKWWLVLTRQWHRGVSVFYSGWSVSCFFGVKKVGWLYYDLLFAIFFSWYQH